MTEDAFFLKKPELMLTAFSLQKPVNITAQSHTRFLRLKKKTLRFYCWLQKIVI
jgi:hypothetical protein